MLTQCSDFVEGADINAVAHGAACACSDGLASHLFMGQVLGQGIGDPAQESVPGTDGGAHLHVGRPGPRGARLGGQEQPVGP